MVLPAVAALLELGPVVVDEVDRIDVHVSHLGALACAETDPPNTVAARSSIPYVLSAVVTFRDELAADPHLTGFYTDAKLADSRRQDLARRIRVLGSDDFERGFEQEWPLRFPARAVLHRRSGSTQVAEAQIAERWSDERVIEKFADLATPVLHAGNVERVVEEVFNLDRRPSVARLVGGLA
jgi:2-methylcitrate dehydratase PrpD